MRTGVRAGFLAAIVVALAGFATGKDVFGAPEADYVADAAARAESVDWTKAESITVTLSEFDFSPPTLTFRAGAPYRLVLKNVGVVTHTFVSEGFFKAIAAHELRRSEGDVAIAYIEKIVLARGATKELLFVAAKPGTYDLACTVFLHDMFGMNGSISIE